MDVPEALAVSRPRTRGDAEQAGKQAGPRGGQAGPPSPCSPDADDTDSALAAADGAIESLFGGGRRKHSWLQPVAEETSDADFDCPEIPEESPTAAERAARRSETSDFDFDCQEVPEESPSAAERAARRSVPGSTLFYELTETQDALVTDGAEADFGLSQSAFQQIEEQFGRRDRKPQLFYELTEDMSSLNTGADWQDSDFGLADWQLEELWKRFDTRMVSEPDTPVAEDGGGAEPARLQGAGPEEHGAGGDSPCLDALQSAEDAVGGAGLAKLHDFLGDHTLEQFIGEKAPAPPPAGMRVWMLSTRTLDGEDWYLFKVSDRGTNRFYMKAFSDFEELHAALLRATPDGRTLPALPQKDFLGLRRWMLGPDFRAQRSQQLRAYVDELMTQFLTLSQEQALRGFFGATARGRVLPPAAGPGSEAPPPRPFASLQQPGTELWPAI